MDTTLRTVLCLLIHCALFKFGACGFFGPSLEEGPMNKTVLTGDSVSLICDLEDNNERTVMWYSYQTQSYITRNDDVRNPMLRDRFSVNVNYTTQMYTLHIDDIMLTDAGTYECAYLVGSQARSLAMAQLKVLSAPISQPECRLTYLPTMGMAEGDSGEVDVSCSWTSNYTGKVQGSLFQGDVKLRPDVDLGDRIISRVDLGDAAPSVTFRCDVSLAELEFSRSCTIDTESNPYIKVGINPLLSKTRSGSSVSMDCYGQSSDTISEYAWRIPVNDSYQTWETYHPEKNSTSLVISGLDSSTKNVVVECEVSTENGRKESTVAVVNVKPDHHPLKSSKVIISLLAGLMILLLISVVIVCVVCASRKPKKRSISRQRLLARKGNGPAAYDTVAKYYQDGHLSLNLDSPDVAGAIADLDMEDEPVSHKRSSSIRSALYTKPIKLPKKKSRGGKSFKNKTAARSVSQISGGSNSDSNVLYENISRTGSISSLYSRFSTGSGSSATCVDETPIAPERRKTKENVYGDDPVIKHSYLGIKKTQSAADAFSQDEHDDDIHDYMSIDNEEDPATTTTTTKHKPLQYVELDLTEKSPKDKKKPKVKWADGGVVYTELNI